jgi:hypothetical protein
MIKYTAWNLRRCNIFFTVWWSTYRKINACARSQNDNMRYSDLTIVSVSFIINLNSTNVDLKWRFIFRLDDRRWQSRDSNLRLSSERRKRENDINNHNNHILFYQPFPVLQMVQIWHEHLRWIRILLQHIERWICLSSNCLDSSRIIWLIQIILHDFFFLQISKSRRQRDAAMIIRRSEHNIFFE